MNVYETHVIKNPQLPFILHTMKFPTRHYGQSNWHENIELLFFTGGDGTVTCGTLRLPFHAGDIVVVNSNDLHNISTNTSMYYYCLIVDRSFCLANHFDTNDIHFDPLFSDPDLTRCMEELVQEYALPQTTPYRTQAIRAAVLQIMVILCRRHSQPASGDGADVHLLSCIKKAIGMIRSDCNRDISLDDAAEFVGLSKFYFAREFKRITGYTFVSYVNLTRCDKAKILLAENQESIGTVAKRCGFSNQSYFTRAFRAYTGKLPSTYREEHCTCKSTPST